MNRGWMKRTMSIAMVMIVVLVLGSLTGCGGKAKIVDDPTAGSGADQIEDLPPPPVPEDDTTDQTTLRPDYDNMEPAEYGIEDVFFALDAYELDNRSMGLLSASARIWASAPARGGSMTTASYFRSSGRMSTNTGTASSKMMDSMVASKV